MSFHASTDFDRPVDLTTSTATLVNSDELQKYSTSSAFLTNINVVSFFTVTNMHPPSMSCVEKFVRAVGLHFKLTDGRSKANQFVKQSIDLLKIHVEQNSQWVSSLTTAIDTALTAQNVSVNFVVLNCSITNGCPWAMHQITLGKGEVKIPIAVFGNHVCGLDFELIISTHSYRNDWAVPISSHVVRKFDGVGMNLNLRGHKSHRIKQSDLPVLFDPLHLLSTENCVQTTSLIIGLFSNTEQNKEYVLVETSCGLVKAAMIKSTERFEIFSDVQKPALPSVSQPNPQPILQTNPRADLHRLQSGGLERGASRLDNFRPPVRQSPYPIRPKQA